MPFVLLIVGLLAVVSAIRGTEQQFGAQLVSDLKGAPGSPGYIYWVSAIIAVGVVGYYAPLRTFSKTFMALILLGMILANQGLFARLSQALQSPQSPTGAPDSTASAGQTSQNMASLGNNALAFGAQELAEFALA